MFTENVGQFLKDDGVFITSGIIDVRENDVLDAFEKYGFKVVGRHENGGWLCFETVKK
jgi:ribosomal protein L11 methyltransferase